LRERLRHKAAADETKLHVPLSDQLLVPSIKSPPATHSSEVLKLLRELVQLNTDVFTSYSHPTSAMPRTATPSLRWPPSCHTRHRIALIPSPPVSPFTTYVIHERGETHFLKPPILTTLEDRIQFLRLLQAQRARDSNRALRLHSRTWKDTTILLASKLLNTRCNKHLIQKVRRVLNRVKLHHNLSIGWVKAHSGGSTPEALGNAAADRLAARGSTGSTSPPQY